MTRAAWNVASEEGFMACYRATFDEVYRYTAMLCGSDRPLAEDVVQDVYMTALDRARAGQLASCSIGYLVVAARHRFLDRVRAAAREDRRLRLVSSVPDEPVAVALPPQLSDLPDRERAALVLRYVDDLSVAQVGAELGISTHAAESLLARATKRLRHQEVRDA
jgi:RNA polymerase sigma-70 factor (ECF subfamily)